MTLEWLGDIFRDEGKEEGILGSLVVGGEFGLVDRGGGDGGFRSLCTRECLWNGDAGVCFRICLGCGDYGGWGFDWVGGGDDRRGHRGGEEAWLRNGQECPCSINIVLGGAFSVAEFDD